MPRVSVVIPAYNAARFIAHALRSALQQTYADMEIIVVDDGSSDESAAIAESMPGVTTLRQQNAGVSAARNAGVAIASGELIAFLDADDVWHADKIAAQVALLDRHPQSDLAYTRVTERLPALDGPLARRDSLVTQLATTFLNPYLCTSTVMVRRAAFDRVGGFDPALRYAEDVDFYLRIAIERPVIPVLESAAVFKRPVANSLGDDSVAGYEKLIALYAHLLETHAELFSEHPRMVSRAIADLQLRYSRCLLRKGERQAALRAARESLSARPSLPATIALLRSCMPDPLLRAARRIKRMLADEHAAP